MTTNAIRSVRPTRRTLTEAVQQELRHAILSGAYTPGSQLPTEAELGQMLGASRTVVREALRTLEEDGLILRRHGVGTFVRKHAILNNLSVNYGITDMIRMAGLGPGTAHLAVRTEPADEEIATQLDVPPGAPVMTVERVRTADDRPVVYSQDTFAESLLDGAEFDPNRLLTESIYDILQSQFNHPIDYGIARILPVQAPPHVAPHLGLPDRAMLLCLLQIDYSPLDAPLLFSREFHLPDAFDFMILRRGPSKLGVP